MYINYITFYYFNKYWKDQIKILKSKTVISIPITPPTKTSRTECTSESTLLCATIKAKRKESIIDNGSSLCYKGYGSSKENAMAECPRLGIPPFKGVPSPKIAFTIIVIKQTSISNINIVYGLELLIL